MEKNRAFLLGTALSVVLAAGGPAAAQQVVPVTGSSGTSTEAPGTASATQAPAPTSGTPGVPAANPDAGQLGDIIVTAQRREESLQRAAVSVTAIGATTLVEKGVTQITQLTQLAPALKVNAGQGPYVTFAVRGINNLSVNAFADSAVVVNLDGIPLTHPTGAHGLFFDDERVEVLKGPQGTLYGRNATGGAVNIITAKPSFTTGGYVNAEYGNYNRKLLSGAVNLPVSDTLALRLAGQLVKRDPYYRDGTGDESAQSVRGSLRFKPGSNTTIDLVGDYTHEGGHGAGSAVIASRDTIGGPLGTLHFIVDPWAGSLNQDDRIQRLYAPYARRRAGVAYNNNRYYGATLSAITDLGFGSLTSISSYRATRLRFGDNVASFYNAEHTDTSQYSTELRLSSNGQGRLRYLVGGFYLHDKLDGQYIVESTPVLINNQDLHNSLETYAGFGQLTFVVVDKFRLTGGLRYTHESKTANSVRRDIGFTGTPPYDFSMIQFRDFPPISQGTYRFGIDNTVNFRSVTWKAGIEFDPAPRSLLYANVGTGFKAGGFYFGPPGANSYRPEKVTAYTIGSKNRFFENRLQFNIEGFYYHYVDQQISHFRIQPAPFGNTFVVDNAGLANIYGVEAEAEARVAVNTRLRAQAQYLHGKYDRLTYVSPTPTTGNYTCPSPAVAGGYQLDCSGRRMLYSPRWLFTGGIDQTIPLANGARLVASVDSRYESSRETALNYLPETHAPSYTRTDLSLAYDAPKNRFSVTAFVQNLENKAVIVQGFAGRNLTIATGGITTATLEPPRTYGVRVGVKF